MPDDARTVATISVAEAHARAIFCVVCYRPVRNGPHMHVMTRGWETCGYCSEGCALSYVRSVDADLPDDRRARPGEAG